MKRYRFSALLAASAMMALGMSSCSDEDDAISDLKGVFEAPVDLSVSGANIVDKSKDGALRTYTVDFATQEGVTLHMIMVSNQYFLTANGYTIAEAATAKNGNFVSGSSVNGVAVTDGTFSLVKNGDDYSISRCTLFTADGKAYRLTGNVVMPFEPDDPTALSLKPTVGMDGTPSLYVDNGDGTVTITFTTGGYTESFNMTTFQNEYSGEGNDLQVVFKLTDGKLTPGVYAPESGYVAGYTFMNNAFEAFGVPPFPDFGGTLWYTIAGGAKTPAMVTSGDIVVTKAGPIYTILLDQGKGGVYAQFTGTLGDLDPDGAAGNVVMLNNCLGVTNLAAMGFGQSILIPLVDGDVTSSFDETTFVTSYAGSGTMLQIEVSSTDGSMPRGEYSVENGKLVAGYVGPMGDSGTFLREIKEGQPGEALFIAEGTLTIEGEGDDTTFTLKTGDDVYIFKGNIGI